MLVDVADILLHRFGGGAESGPNLSGNTHVTVKQQRHLVKQCQSVNSSESSVLKHPKFSTPKFFISKSPK